MDHETLIVGPCPDSRFVVTQEGRKLRIPEDWALLPPGDSGLTRKLKSLGPSWTVKVRRRRRLESRGVWAPAENVAEARRLVEEKRATPEYERDRRSAARRRDRAQEAYVSEFEAAVKAFLAFDPRHAQLEAELARAVAEHATPIGSGTVARTRRIPVEERAEAALIAWMRHQTTDYDDQNPRRKGERRELRRQLAERSRRLLRRYRRGEDAEAGCPLRRALESASEEKA